MPDARIIQLPINRPMDRYLSSGDYDATVSEGLSVLDLLYTYVFRYVRLWTVDINKSTISQGATIDLAAADPAVGITITALFLAASVVTVIHSQLTQQEKNKQEAAQQRQTYNQVLTRLQQPAVDQTAEQKKESERQQFNLALKKVLAESGDEFDYEQVELTAEGLVNFSLKNKPVPKKSRWNQVAQKLSAMVHATWVTAGIASFVYWIFWVAWLVLTAMVAAAGIGSTGIYGFIPSIIVAAVYPLIKIYNWWRNNYGSQAKVVDGKNVKTVENPKKKYKAAADLTKLMNRTIYIVERERLENELKLAKVPRPTISRPSAKDTEKLEADKKIRELGKNKWSKTIITFLTVAVSSYIGAHYVAWIVGDILNVTAGITLSAAGFTLGFGIAFIALSVMYGAYKAYQRYQEVEAHARKIASEFNADKISLEAICRSKLSTIARLTVEIDNLSVKASDKKWLTEQTTNFASSKIISVEAPPAAPKRSTWEILKTLASRGYTFLGGATGGIMMVRIAVIVGTVAFVPFVAAAIVNPFVTLALLIAVGLAWGALKTYQAYQAEIEADAKNLQGQRHETKFCLGQQSQLSSLQIKVLEAKKAALLAERASRNSTPTVGLKKSASNDDVLGLFKKKPTLFSGSAPSSPKKTYIKV